MDITYGYNIWANEQFGGTFIVSELSIYWFWFLN